MCSMKTRSGTRFLAAALCAATLAAPGAGAQATFPDEAAQAQRLAALGRLALAGKPVQAAMALDMLVAQDEQCRPAADARCLRPLILALKASAELHLQLRHVDAAMGRYARLLDVYQADVAGLDPKVYPFVFGMLGALAARHERPALMLPYLQETLGRPGSDRGRDAWFRQAARQRLGQLALADGDAAGAEAALLLAVDERAALAGIPYPGTNAAGGWNAQQGDLTAFMNLQQRLRENNGYIALANQVMRPDGQEVAPPFADATWSGTTSAVTLLVGLYRDQGRADDLAAFHAGAFARYAQRELANPQAFGHAELEAEYAHFAAAFGAAGRWQPARAALAQALRLNAQRLRAESAALPPDQLVAAFATRRALVDLQLSLHLASGADPREWLELAGNVLQDKGTIAEMQARRAAVVRHTPMALERAQEDFLSLFDPLNSVEDFHFAAAASRQLQARLAPRIAPLEFVDGAGFSAALRALPGPETYVAIHLFQPWDLARRQDGPPHYLGILLDASRIRLVDLGPARTIDPLLLALRAGIAVAPAAGADPLPAARAAYDAVLAPLLGRTAPAGRHVADVDGRLAALPLDAMADADGRYLVERTEWRYVASARTLAAPRGTALSGPALVVAGVDYDAPLSAAYYPEDDKPVGKGSRRERMRGMRLAPLPAAEEEGRIVLDALRRGGAEAGLLAGAAASAEALQEIHGPRVLHLATHGLYLRGAVQEDKDGTFGGAYVVEHRAAWRNGALALAGANTTLASGKGGGIMYAARLQRLDLEGTALVVLSACQSGNGEATAGEVADSLRQAVEIAGARASIGALWEVPDSGTRDLMAALYAGLAAGRDGPAALRAARLDVKARLPHPFYWAPFVFSGAP